MLAEGLRRDRGNDFVLAFRRRQSHLAVALEVGAGLLGLGSRIVWVGHGGSRLVASDQCGAAPGVPDRTKGGPAWRPEALVSPECHTTFRELAARGAPESARAAAGTSSSVPCASKRAQD